MDQTIADLTPAEIDWVAQQQQAAIRFVSMASARDVDAPVTLADLDSAFKVWITKEPTDADEINGVINAVGVAFGQHLVDGAGLKWVIATDQHGSELAVYGLPGAGDVLVYPANFVAKRWERRETDFLEKAYRQMSADIRSVAMEHAGRTARPWWKFW
jgi:hypothetical protein